ncbi:MAG: GMC family oxidoreductase [FCB group bacterium]|nr:GMC family oxidoreductase [FCB group bacterium]
MKPDYDYIIIGSGFGGSVSALRLAEKGYSVAVLEKGREYTPEAFPESNWNLRKFLWLPKFHLYGIQALTLLKDVFVLHGSGVGGGSLVYANNLLIPPDKVFKDSIWHIKNVQAELEPYYQLAKEMLGATKSKVLTKADQYLKACADDIGRGETFHVNDVGIFFGEPGITVTDPYFDGEGPPRTGCTLCGSCMTGCRDGGKNTLDKNYLFLARKKGVKIFPETEAISVTPAREGGYLIKIKKSTGFRAAKGKLASKGVIFSGGVMGTVKLLLKLKNNGALPAISDQLGAFVRTNSEALVGAVANESTEDYSKGIAITSGIYPDEHTHIETVRYGKGHNAMALLGTLLVDDSPIFHRSLVYLGQIIKHPGKFIKSLKFSGWSERTTILLVMQTLSNYLTLDYRRRWWRFGGYSLNSRCQKESRVPAYNPVANDFARRMSEKIGGEPLSVLPEVLMNTSSTAHILGGCVLSDSKANGVVDITGKIHGYEDLYVIDGSIVPVNLGVNPSLTITALAEYLLNKFPEK